MSNILIITKITSPEEIGNCFDIFLELRPHLRNKEQFVAQVIKQQKETYQIAAVFEEGQAAACIGFRVITTLAWGKIIYIDDLITGEQFRAKGYGSLLLEYAINKAKEMNCDQVHLDSGYTRNAAHKHYLKHGFELNSHHFSLKLK